MTEEHQILCLRVQDDPFHALNILSDFDGHRPLHDLWDESIV
jgi:hypothetical protein